MYVPRNDLIAMYLRWKVAVVLQWVSFSDSLFFIGCGLFGLHLNATVDVCDFCYTVLSSVALCMDVSNIDGVLCENMYLFLPVHGRERVFAPPVTLSTFHRPLFLSFFGVPSHPKWRTSPVKCIDKHAAEHWRFWIRDLVLRWKCYITAVKLLCWGTCYRINRNF